MVSAASSALWQQLDYLPEAFFEVAAHRIREVFPQPTLVSLPGQKPQALFVAILMHGNEYSGLKAMQKLLHQYRDGLPRRLHLFIANVEAAAAKCRFLESQTDFNRAWPGSELPGNATTEMMQQIWQFLRDDGLFAAIDLHNNTGTNPHYGCISNLRHENQYICSLFNHIAMVFERPKGVCSMAFDHLCPSVTLECGRPGEPLGIEKTLDVLETLLHLDHFPEREVLPQDLQLVKTLATLYVKPDIDFGFSDEVEEVSLRFAKGFEKRNFTELYADECFAISQNTQPLLALDQHGENITSSLLRQENTQLFLNRTLIPAMITPDKDIIRKDCLCYLLQDLDRHQAPDQ